MRSLNANFVKTLDLCKYFTKDLDLDRANHSGSRGECDAFCVNHIPPTREADTLSLAPLSAAKPL